MILGSGTLVPTGVRGPARLRRARRRPSPAFDGGSGTLRRLHEAGIDYRAIDQLFYTHIHPDHTGDLVPFLFAQRYRPAPARTQAIALHGPRGFTAFLTHLKAIYGRWIEGPRVRPRGTRSCGIRRPPPVHSGSPPSRCGTRWRPSAIGSRGRTASPAPTGDTTSRRARSSRARGGPPDRRLLDAGRGQDRRPPDPGLVGELATAAEVRMVCLTHFYPACDQVDGGAVPSNVCRSGDRGGGSDADRARGRVEPAVTMLPPPLGPR